LPVETFVNAKWDESDDEDELVEASLQEEEGKEDGFWLRNSTTTTRYLTR
jgi:hypothetical protein